MSRVARPPISQRAEKTIGRSRPGPPELDTEALENRKEFERTFHRIFPSRNAHAVKPGGKSASK
jgi:hypothetical protein